MSRLRGSAFEQILPTGWRRGPWANGGGTTHTIAAWTDVAGATVARVSVAEIDRAGPFSRFAGNDRWLAVLDVSPHGSDGVLGLEIAGTAHLVGTGSAVSFSGDDAVSATPTSPTRVFNLIVRRDLEWHAAIVGAGVPYTLPATPHLAIIFSVAARTTLVGTSPDPVHLTGPVIVVRLRPPDGGLIPEDGALCLPGRH